MLALLEARFRKMLAMLRHDVNEGTVRLDKVPAAGGTTMKSSPTA